MGIAVPQPAAREQAASVIVSTIIGPVATRRACLFQSGVITTTAGCTRPSRFGIARCSPSRLLLLLLLFQSLSRRGIWMRTRPLFTRAARRMAMIADILAAVHAAEAGVS